MFDIKVLFAACFRLFSLITGKLLLIYLLQLKRILVSRGKIGNVLNYVLNILYLWYFVRIRLLFHNHQVYHHKPIELILAEAK